MTRIEKAAALHRAAQALVDEGTPFTDASIQAVHVRNALFALSNAGLANLFDHIARELVRP